ncbi:MAG TPA: hypothetical protein DCQ93_02730 [Bacteroidetes bacterium]|nr:hypothetical protein [Bacteroidota bacterium]
MKKFYIILLCLFATVGTKAQTILFEDFEEDSATFVNKFFFQFPSGNDTVWIDADLDGIADASGGNRPNEWFRSFGFAYVDSTNIVMASNSWTNDAQNPVANYLILPPIHLNDASGMLKWKSAPRQTPRYLDGLQVLASTAGNLDNAFSDTLMLYAEMTALPANTSDSAVWSAYTFSPGFQFGSDGQYVEVHNGDSARLVGVLRPDSASLSGYAGQNIYIAFCHGTHDDNLISIDDIEVDGNGTVLAFAPSADNFSLNVFPNPASDKITVQYSSPSFMVVDISIYDELGRKVQTIERAQNIKGNYSFNADISKLAAGNYNIILNSTKGNSMIKFSKM